MTHSDESMFDPRLAEWLEADPNEAPDQALEIVLAAFPSIKQRRAWGMPWRLTMPSLTKAVAVGVAALAIVIGGAWFLGSRGPSVGSPTLSPGASSEATAPPGSTPPGTGQPSGPAMAEFVSPQYGYSVEVPAAYQFIPATETWPAGEAIGPETAWTDRFRAGTNFVGIASQVLPEGTTDDEWMDAYTQSVESRECGAPASQWTEMTFREIPGRTLLFDCGGAAGREYAWVLGNRGWVISGEAAVAELFLESLSVR
jgi:hypothetical protein